MNTGVFFPGVHLTHTYNIFTPY